jgi:hypothetical protein
VRRTGGLWPRVVAFPALVDAARRAARGKRESLGAARFFDRLEPEVLRLARELDGGTWRPSPAQRFVIHDPKCRTITAVPFADRVVHHALIAPLEPVFERHLLPHSFACRRGRGTHAALAAARALVRRHPFALKLDVARCFDSLRHDVVIATLRSMVKDGRVLDLARTILAGAPGDAPPPEPGRGLPIGSLTSQWFANVALSRLDRFVVERLRPGGYVRYMDDFVLFAGDAAALRAAHAEIATFLRDALSLQLKDRATRLAPVHAGVPFLGFSLFPGCTRVRPATLRRARWRLRFLRWRLARGEIGIERYRQGVAAVLLHLGHASTLRLRQRLCAAHTLEL